jgi:hypothetical protein
MAAFTRINGFANFGVGTLYATSDQKVFKLEIKDGSGAIDLRDQDGAAADELVEKIVGTLNPLMYYAENNAAGNIHVVMHGHNVDAADIKARLVGLSGNLKTITSATVVSLGTAIAVS